MQLKVNKLEGSRVELAFTATVEEFEEALNKAFEIKVKDVKVDGFRPGHVTREIYNKKFGEESLYDEAINFILNDSYRYALENKKIDVCGEPEVNVDFTTVGKGKKMKYSITVDVYPEVTLGEYKGIEVEREKVEVTDEDVEHKISHTLENYAHLDTLEEGELQEGNTAVFDFDGSVDGEHFEGGKAEGYSLEIGSHQFIPGFEEQMVGMKKGEEKDISVKFPDDYHAENLKGKEAVFHIVLHEIKVKHVPELNDEFVLSLEIENVKTVEEYKVFVRDALVADREEAATNKVNDDIITKVVDNATLTVPEGLIIQAQNRQLRQLENQAKAYGLPLEVLLQYYGIGDKQTYLDAIKPNCEASVKQDLVFSQIAKVEKLKVTAKDYEHELQIIANETEKPIEELKKVYTKEAITPYILMTKAIELVKANAIIK